MTRSWDSILQTYDSFANTKLPCVQLGNLVGKICQSPLERRIFGWTSHATLCIVPRPVTYPDYMPHLEIRQLTSVALSFQYVDALDRTKQWQRTYEGEAAFGGLIGFLRNVRWIPDGEIGNL